MITGIASWWYSAGNALQTRADVKEFSSLEEKLQADVELVEAFIETVNKDEDSPELRVSLAQSSLTDEQKETSVGRAVSNLEVLKNTSDELGKLRNPTDDERALKQTIDERIAAAGDELESLKEKAPKAFAQAEENVQAKADLAIEGAKATKNLQDASARAAAIGGGIQGGQTVESALEIRDAVQCWLLYNTVPLARYGQERYLAGVEDGLITNPGFFSNNLQPSSDKRRISLVDKDTEGIALTGLLNYRKGTKDFINIQSHEYAQLNPTLRIYKVINDSANRPPPGQAKSTTQRLVEMEFSNHTTLDGIARQLQSTRPTGDARSVFTRGSEVGVKSFEWSFLGSDPFTATRDINATLKFHAQSLASFVASREGPELKIKSDGTPGAEVARREYRYIDLLVQPECQDDYAPECFEVRIDVGYAPIGGTETQSMRQGVKDSVASQKDILYLVLTDHSFDVADDGSVDITVNFRGRLETIMKTRKMNVLLPYGGVLQKSIPLAIEGESSVKDVAQAEALIKELNRTKPEGYKDRVEKAEAAIADLSFQYKQIINAFILASLMDKGLIYQYTIPDADFEIFKLYKSKLSSGAKLPVPMNSTGFSNIRSSDPEAIGRAVANAATDQEGLDEQVEAVDNRYMKLNRLQKRTVNFFFLGDLLGVVLDNITGENTITGGIEDLGWFRSAVANVSSVFGGDRATLFQDIEISTDPEKEVIAEFDKFRIILGNLDLDEKVNLAHVPISVDAYSAFFANTVLASEKTDYSFYSFVEDVLSQLVMDPLSSRCFAGLFDTGFRPRVQHYVSPNVISDDLYVDGDTPNPFASPYKVLKPRNSTTGEPEEMFKRGMDSDEIPALYQYMTISSEVTDLDTLKGCEENDRMKGIVHLHFGNAHGMVKKISFSKSDIEYLPEMRYAAEGNFLYNQLANVYDANVELVGNNIFKPGQYVYIDTSALGAGDTWHRNSDGTSRSWANLMGLGGYHVITEVAHSVSREGFNTSIKARWVASGQRNSGEGCS